MDDSVTTFSIDRGVCRLDEFANVGLLFFPGHPSSGARSCPLGWLSFLTGEAVGYSAKYFGKKLFFDRVDCSPDVTVAIHYAHIITLTFLRVSSVTFGRSVLVSIFLAYR